MVQTSKYELSKWVNFTFKFQTWTRILAKLIDFIMDFDKLFSCYNVYPKFSFKCYFSDYWFYILIYNTHVFLYVTFVFRSFIIWDYRIWDQRHISLLLLVPLLHAKISIFIFCYNWHVLSVMGQIKHFWFWFFWYIGKWLKSIKHIGFIMNLLSKNFWGRMNLVELKKLNWRWC